MRIRATFPWLASGILLSPLGIMASRPAPRAVSIPRPAAQPAPIPAGEYPAFMLVSVQPFEALESWRVVYQEVERCAGRKGNFDGIRWAAMAAPMQGPKGPTYAFMVNNRVVLVQHDTTYLRHEMLHQILEVSGWRPRELEPGERYSLADLHPSPVFGRCAGVR